MQTTTRLCEICRVVCGVASRIKLLLANGKICLALLFCTDADAKFLDLIQCERSQYHEKRKNEHTMMAEQWPRHKESSRRRKWPVMQVNRPHLMSGGERDERSTRGAPFTSFHSRQLISPTGRKPSYTAGKESA